MGDMAMEPRISGTERRGEGRYATAGRIFWNKVGRNVSHVGWLSDTSRSGAAFVTTTSDHLSVGTEVELKDLRRPPWRSRVTRIEPYGNALFAGRLPGARN